MDDWPTCDKCGGGLEWDDCTNGCDEGYFDLYDEDPVYYDEHDVEPCQICQGQGGWWLCPTCRERALAAREEEAS